MFIGRAGRACSLEAARPAASQRAAVLCLACPCALVCCVRSSCHERWLVTFNRVLRIADWEGWCVHSINIWRGYSTIIGLHCLLFKYSLSNLVLPSCMVCFKYVLNTTQHQNQETCVHWLTQILATQRTLTPTPPYTHTHTRVDTQIIYCEKRSVQLNWTSLFCRCFSVTCHEEQLQQYVILYSWTQTYKSFSFSEKDHVKGDLQLH